MKYPITFFLLACLISGYAFYLGGWGYLLLWFSFSCFALAIGYSGLGPKVFGKRPDGSLPIWSKAIHLPFLLYTWFTWNIIRLLSRENPTDQITPDIIIGRRLYLNEIPRNMEHYIDLTAEFEDPKSIRQSLKYLCLPILDGSVPSVQKLHSVILRVPNGLTYIHCAQGHGRTGLFVIALLAARGYIQSVDEGIDLLKKLRPGVGLNSKQMKFIDQYIAKYFDRTNIENDNHQHWR